MHVNDVENELNQILESLILPIADDDKLIKLIEDFSKLNTLEIADCKGIALDVFYQISSLIKDEQLKNDYLIKAYKKSFENIVNIVNEETENSSRFQETENPSRFLVFNFLKDLYNNILEQNNSLFDKMLQDMDAICSELETIRYVFRIQNDDGSLYFPISELLFHVLLNDDYHNDVWDDKLIYKLRIALEIFKTNKFKDKKKIMDQMSNDYNIKLIEYMADIKNSFLGENEEWKLNLKYNKVICIIRNEREIYIRHPDKSYFDKKILNKYHIANVQKEINNNGKAIAYFVEFQLSDAVKFISIDQILKGDDLKSKLDLTFMLLQQNAKNIFLNNSLYIDNGEVKLINPFCVNDNYLINTKRASRVNSNNSNTVIENILKKYYQNMLREKGLDFVLYSSLVELLLINNNCKKDAFMNFENDCVNHYQNGLILTWLKSIPTTERISALSEFISTFTKDTDYVNNDYNLDIANLKWLAFELPCEEILSCIFNKDEKEIVLNSTKDIIKRKKNRNIYVDSNNEEIDENKIIKKDLDENDLDEGDCLHYQDNYYLNDRLQKGLKIRDLIRDINDNLNPYKEFIDPTNIKLPTLIVDKIKLQDNILLSLDGVECNDKSNHYIRILNHLFIYDITVKKQENFMKLISYHKVTDFKEACAQVKSMLKPNVLFIPKEKYSTDNTLTRIYENYLREEKFREHSLYLHELAFYKGKYCIEKKEIKKICFIFDTVLSGKQTVDNLKNYFSEAGKTKDDRSNKYYCERKEIPIKDIMYQNNIDSVTCVFLNYAHIDKPNIDVNNDNNKKDNSWQGKVDDFFKSIDVKYEIEKIHDIDFGNNNAQIFKLAKQLYGKIEIDEDKAFFPLIREFNMPKKAVFPKKCMKDPRLISCLFGLKKEM